MSQTKIKVLLADDNKEFCDVVVSYLNKQEDITVVAVAYDGVDACNKIQECRPDIAVIDGIMPRLDGLGVLERLQKNKDGFHPVCIMLSAITQEKVIQKAMDLGAAYYIVKPFESKELLARVKAVLRRYEQKPEKKQNNVKKLVFPNLEINISNYTVEYYGESIDFPPKEFELLHYLAENPNQVFTREQLLDRIWGYEYIGDTRTVDVHIKRIREKLNKQEESWSIKTVWGVGYKFELK